MKRFLCYFGKIEAPTINFLRLCAKGSSHPWLYQSLMIHLTHVHLSRSKPQGPCQGLTSKFLQVLRDIVNFELLHALVTPALKAI